MGTSSIFPVSCGSVCLCSFSIQTKVSERNLWMLLRLFHAKHQTAEASRAMALSFVASWNVAYAKNENALRHSIKSEPMFVLHCKCLCGFHLRYVPPVPPEMPIFQSYTTFSIGSRNCWCKKNKPRYPLHPRSLWILFSFILWVQVEQDAARHKSGSQQLWLHPNPFLLLR